MKTTKELNLRKIPSKVVKLDSMEGGDVFNTRQFTVGKEYEVLGMTKHVFEDHSNTLCFILINDKGKTEEVTVDHFKVLELEGVQNKK